MIRIKRYITGLLICCALLILGYISGFRFSPMSIVNERMEKMNLYIQEYSTIMQDSNKFYICKSKNDIVFFSIKRYLGVLWIKNMDSIMRINENPITFNIYSYNSPESILYGICTNENVKYLVLTLDSDINLTYKINELGTFMYELEGSVYQWERLTVLDANNNEIWSSDDK